MDRRPKTLLERDPEGLKKKKTEGGCTNDLRDFKGKKALLSEAGEKGGE